jgi:transcriptional regulator of met regulon
VRITPYYVVYTRSGMSKKGKISKPMKVLSIRIGEEERAFLESVAEEHDVTVSWLLRAGAKYFAEDLSKWLEDRTQEGPFDGRIAGE